MNIVMGIAKHTLPTNPLPVLTVGTPVAICKEPEG